MKNVVMGTAGHIDHGKTALVKRLTGVDTDRLEEEKRRGMTIELGFAPLTLPSGKVISVIDVPGHEKFVKTMVAGVTGIDFVMLVIAADEGIMPQTKEHMDILSLLKIKAGVIALTKIDLVEDEWLQMVKADIKESLKGTGLEDYPIMPVSSVTGDGIQELMNYLEKLAKEAANINVEEIFRLSVDRVFTISGHGTVVTGTLSGGEISKGEIVQVLPSRLQGKVRGIQVHNKSVEFAVAGDRCALNITGVEKADIERGNVIVKEGIINPTKLVDAVLFTTKDVEKIEHNQRVHVHIGTKEVLARIRILGSKEIAQEGKGYVQLRFEEPVVALRGDRFIVRSYSPVTTIGGGWIIFHSTVNRQRFSDETMEVLKIGELGSSEKVIELILKSSGRVFSVHDLCRETLIDKINIQENLIKLIELEKVVHLTEVDKYISKELYRQYLKEIYIEFDNLYNKNPFRFQIDKEEIKSKVFKNLDTKEFTNLLNVYIEDNLLKLRKNFIIKADMSIINKIFQREETKLLEKIILEYGLDITNISSLKKSINLKEHNIEDIIKFLVETEKIVDLGNEMFVHRDILKDTMRKIREIFQRENTASVVSVRDYLGISRKVAVAVLEYLDSLGVTIREENLRKPGVHYMDYFI